jgi:hypothetical protein
MTYSLYAAPGGIRNPIDRLVRCCFDIILLPKGFVKVEAMKYLLVL